MDVVDVSSNDAAYRRFLHGCFDGCYMDVVDVFILFWRFFVHLRKCQIKKKCVIVLFDFCNALSKGIKKAAKKRLSIVVYLSTREKKILTCLCRNIFCHPKPALLGGCPDLFKSAGI